MGFASRCERFVNGNVKVITGLSALNDKTEAVTDKASWCRWWQTLLNWGATKPEEAPKVIKRNKKPITLQRHMLGALYMKPEDAEALTNPEVDIILQLKNKKFSEHKAGEVLEEIKQRGKLPTPSTFSEKLKDSYGQSTINWDRFMIDDDREVKALVNRLISEGKTKTQDELVAMRPTPSACS